eukprot:TRINITY_DN22352_c0_g2_i1.p1 TRINITY_DN22352_c0_g2~~TRINITY_DN22352_c0_g2_i1.p1  ORF type:complete len:553 (-),score=90.22 TRINITY_DN22352_c0_g2_i1:119-1723(-)
MTNSPSSAAPTAFVNAPVFLVAPPSSPGHASLRQTQPGLALEGQEHALTVGGLGVSASGSGGHFAIAATALYAASLMLRRRGSKRYGRRGTSKAQSVVRLAGSLSAELANTAVVSEDFGVNEQLVVNAPKPRRDKIGILLLNIGTPETTSVEDIRKYFRKFLGDDRVIDIKPALLKALVLEILCLTRPASSAENYKKIWDEERGSPLLYHTQDLTDALQRELGDDYEVRIGMQYSEPSVQTSFTGFKTNGIDEVVLVPMFPHYASSTTGSCLDGSYKIASQMYCTPFLSVLPPFFNNPLYLEAMRPSISAAIGERGKNVDHLVFSFHGVPETQCAQCDDSRTVCGKKPGCCSELGFENRNCYRAQCYEAARLLAADLNLDPSFWSIGFQSRLTLRGTVQWIRPYTDVILEDLAKKGSTRVAVVAPSFTADCVETLEELAITGKEEFEEAGGKELIVIPCLNSSEVWVSKLSEILREHITRRGPPLTTVVSAGGGTAEDSDAKLIAEDVSNMPHGNESSDDTPLVGAMSDNNPEQ